MEHRLKVADATGLVVAVAAVVPLALVVWMLAAVVASWVQEHCCRDWEGRSEGCWEDDALDVGRLRDDCLGVGGAGGDTGNGAVAPAVAKESS